MEERSDSYQKYDDVLVEKVGGFGKWQLMVFLVLAVPGTFKGCELLITAFALYEPAFRCDVVPICKATTDSNSSVEFLFDNGCTVVKNKDTDQYIQQCGYNFTQGVRLSVSQKPI